MMVGTDGQFISTHHSFDPLNLFYKIENIVAFSNREIMKQREVFLSASREENRICTSVRSYVRGYVFQPHSKICDCSTQCVQKVHIVATSHTQITQQEINEPLDFIPLISKYFNFVWFLLRQTAWDKNLVFQILNHKGINIKSWSYFQSSFPMRHYSIAHSVYRKNYTQKLTTNN